MLQGTPGMDWMTNQAMEIEGYPQGNIISNYAVQQLTEMYEAAQETLHPSSFAPQVVITLPMVQNLIAMGGVELVKGVMPTRSILAISGSWGTGKTHLALTGPEPVIFFDVDKGTEGVAEKFVAEGKTVVRIPISFPDEGGQNVYAEIWQDMMAKLRVACQIPQGTIVFDSFTILRQLAEWAFLGKITQIMYNQHELYRAPLRNIVRMVYDSGLNGAFLNRYGLKFSTDNKTTEMEVKGWRDIEYECQVSIIMNFVIPDANFPSGYYTGYIAKSRQKPSLVGQTLFGVPGDPVQTTLDFNYLTKLIHS